MKFNFTGVTIYTDNISELNISEVLTMLDKLIEFVTMILDFLKKLFTVLDIENDIDVTILNNL